MGTQANTVIRDVNDITWSDLEYALATEQRSLDETGFSLVFSGELTVRGMDGNMYTLTDAGVSESSGINITSDLSSWFTPYQGTQFRPIDVYSALADQVIANHAPGSEDRMRAEQFRDSLNTIRQAFDDGRNVPNSQDVQNILDRAGRIENRPEPSAWHAQRGTWDRSIQDNIMVGDEYADTFGVDLSGDGRENYDDVEALYNASEVLKNAGCSQSDNIESCRPLDTPTNPDIARGGGREGP